MLTQLPKILERETLAAMWRAYASDSAASSPAFAREFEPHMQHMCQYVVSRAAEFASHCGVTRVRDYDVAQAIMPYMRFCSGCRKEATTGEYVCKLTNHVIVAPPPPRHRGGGGGGAAYPLVNAAQLARFCTAQHGDGAAQWTASMRAVLNPAIVWSATHLLRKLPSPPTAAAVRAVRAESQRMRDPHGLMCERLPGRRPGRTRSCCRKKRQGGRRSARAFAPLNKKRAFKQLIYYLNTGTGTGARSP